MLSALSSAPLWYSVWTVPLSKRMNALMPPTCTVCAWLWWCLHTNLQQSFRYLTLQILRSRGLSSESQAAFDYNSLHWACPPLGTACLLMLWHVFFPWQSPTPYLSMTILPDDGIMDWTQKAWTCVVTSLDGYIDMMVEGWRQAAAITQSPASFPQ